LFSSASRAVDFSTSKMPPQQPDRLLDLFDEAFDFGAHGFLCPQWRLPPSQYVRDVAARPPKRNRRGPALRVLFTREKAARR
jgi:hypothetical protein